jgi:pimeloyl-ACP methyl ester carboxylesterase
MDTRLYDYGLDPDDFPRGLQVERIDDAGHFVHLEQPDAVLALLLAWLDRSPSAVKEVVS